MNGVSISDDVGLFLKDHPEIRFAILFGSLASGTANAESDLDLAVDAGVRLDAPAKMTLISALAEKFGRPVDLIDLRSVGEPLLGQILRHGKVILGSKTRYAELIRQHLFDEADFLRYRNRILSERRQSWIPS